MTCLYFLRPSGLLFMSNTIIFIIERVSFWSIRFIQISKYCFKVSALKSKYILHPRFPTFSFPVQSIIHIALHTSAGWAHWLVFPPFNSINHLSGWDQLHIMLLECNALNLLCFISKLLCIGHWPAINQLKCLSALSIHLCFLCVCWELDLKQCASD